MPASGQAKQRENLRVLTDEESEAGIRDQEPSPNKHPPSEPKLDVIHMRAAEFFEQSLSKKLKSHIELQYLGSREIDFGPALGDLAKVNPFGVFRLEPTGSPCLMALENQAAHELIHLAFGGERVPYTKIEGKKFTAIEARVISTMMGEFAGAYRKSWRPVFHLDLVFERFESSKVMLLSKLPASHLMRELAFELSTPHVRETIKFLLPFEAYDFMQNHVNPTDVKSSLSQLKLRMKNILTKVDRREFTRLVENEHPQTLSMALSLLPSDAAAEIVSRIHESLQLEIAIRLGHSPTVDEEFLEIMVSELEGKVELSESGRVPNAGLKAFIDLIQSMPDAQRAALLDRTNDRDQYLVFETLLAMAENDPEGTREILDAMKTADADLHAMIFPHDEDLPDGGHED